MFSHSWNWLEYIVLLRLHKPITNIQLPTLHMQLLSVELSQYIFIFFNFFHYLALKLQFGVMI